MVIPVIIERVGSLAFTVSVLCDQYWLLHPSSDICSPVLAKVLWFGGWHVQWPSMEHDLTMFVLWYTV